MMESVGSAIGVADLAGVFTAYVDYFEYVQIGHAAKVPISRWGAAMGLGLEPYLKQQISASDDKIRLAQSLLEQILDSFKNAERLSERFKKHTSMQNLASNGLLVYDAVSDLASNYQRLHLTMRELAKQWQKQTSLRKKAAWAIHDKTSFDRMIDDVTGFVHEFTQEDQRALCKMEVSAIRETDDLALLNDIACEGDTMLAAEVKKKMDSRGHTVTDWKAEGNSKIWAGDENASAVSSKGHNFARFTVLDSADVHLGNMNRG